MGSDRIDERILALGSDPSKLKAFVELTGIDEELVKERIRLVESSRKKKQKRHPTRRRLKLR